MCFSEITVKLKGLRGELSGLPSSKLKRQNEIVSQQAVCVCQARVARCILWILCNSRLKQLFRLLELVRISPLEETASLQIVEVGRNVFSCSVIPSAKYESCGLGLMLESGRTASRCTSKLDLPPFLPFQGSTTLNTSAGSVTFFSSLLPMLENGNSNLFLIWSYTCSVIHMPPESARGSILDAMLTASP